MGNKVVTFSDQQLDDYQDCTFFTRKEILRIHKRFRELRPDIVPRQMLEGQASTIKVPRENIEKLPELLENPFKTRICEVFSRDGAGDLTFEDFLDLFSIFSEQAPRDIKVYYAFKIYGEFKLNQFQRPSVSNASLYQTSTRTASSANPI
jgi:calcium and integrin-binding protein 2